MKTILYPTVEEIIFLQELLIQKFGGAAGVLDMGLVESALARVKSGYYESISEQAAALLQSFMLNHCFLDGNKRIAIASCLIFLKINGIIVKIDTTETEKFLIQKVIKEKASIQEIADWLEKRFV